MTGPRWNGEPCKARRVTAIVTDDGSFPQYWARHLVGVRREAVEVEYGDQVFYLDNEDGSGWNKVARGGSPNDGHRSITVDPDSIHLRVDQEELKRLRKDSRKLAALVAQGVDNWEGYGDAMRSLEEDD